MPTCRIKINDRCPFLLKLPKHSKGNCEVLLDDDVMLQGACWGGEDQKGRAELAKRAKLAQRKVNLGTLDRVWFNQPEDLSSLQLKDYARPYSRTPGAIDSLTLFSRDSSDEWEAYL